MNNLRNQITTPAETFESVSIFFSTLEGFVLWISQSKPQEVMEALNGIYSFFDALLPSFSVQKVETVNDEYLVKSLLTTDFNGCHRSLFCQVVSGIPARHEFDHAGELCRMSLALSSSFVTHFTKLQFKLKIGLNSGSHMFDLSTVSGKLKKFLSVLSNSATPSGSCAAGVIGTKVPRYCL